MHSSSKSNNNANCCTDRGLRNFKFNILELIHNPVLELSHVAQLHPRNYRTGQSSPRTLNFGLQKIPMLIHPLSLFTYEVQSKVASAKASPGSRFRLGCSLFLTITPKSWNKLVLRIYYVCQHFCVLQIHIIYNGRIAWNGCIIS